MAQELPVYLERDFWNYIYVVDARVFKIEGSQISVEVNRSWTVNAVPGDTLTFDVLTSSYGFTSEGVDAKPPRLPFRIDHSYLLLSETSTLSRYYIPGPGFYLFSSRLSLSRSIINTAELDSLAMHIGNNPHFDSREWIGTVAFPSGERLSINAMNDLFRRCSTASVNKPMNETGHSGISFHLEEGHLRIHHPFRMPYNRVRRLSSIAVVDSSKGTQFYVTYFLRSPLLSTRWVSQLQKDGVSFHVLLSDCMRINKGNDIPAPIGLEFLDDHMIVLNLSEGAMNCNPLPPVFAYQDGLIRLIFTQRNSTEGSTRQLPRIMLQFSGLERQPGVPDTFIIESALYRESQVPVELFHADSLYGKYHHIFNFCISLDDSTRSSL